MIKHYIRLIESFKKNKISEFIEQIFMKAAYFISSDYASEEIGEYFDFPLSTETVNQLHSIITEINTQAGIATPETLILDEHVTAKIKSMITKASAIGAPFVAFELDKTQIAYLNIREIIQQINMQNSAPECTDNFELPPETLDKIKTLLVEANKTRFPFTNYELDPGNVSQMKKWMNALYYARLTFLDLENTHINSTSTSVQSLQRLYSQTIESAYEASFLATDLDVNFKEIFEKEITLLFQQLVKLQQLKEPESVEAQTHKAQPKPFIDLGYVKKAGEAAGTAIDQMRPINHEVDYSFLTQFSSGLPNHIDSLTQIIQNYSSAIIDKQPKLNQEKLDEIRTAGQHLLNEIEHVQEGNRLSRSLKFLNYIHIISNIITLSLSTLEQVNELNDSSQDVIREQLSHLKYHHLPLLLSLIDKIEINTMLKPGTLSAPLMRSITPLYNALLWLPNKLLDLTTHGEDLLIIEDSRFIELRLEETHKRISEADKELWKTRKTKEALESFYKEIEEHANLALHELPAEVLERLRMHYKLIEPYTIKLDPELNNQIISSLTNATPLESTFVRLARRLWHSSEAPNHISLILRQKKALENLMSKDEKSHLFQIKLNRNVIKSIRTNTDLTIFPHAAAQNVYAIDEGIPLEITHEEQIPFTLKEDALCALQETLIHFNQLIKNHTPNKAEILALHELNDAKKSELAALYKKLHPYLPYIVPIKQQQEMLNLSKYFTKVFAHKITVPQDIPLVETCTKLADACNSYITTARRGQAANESEYFSIIDRKYLSPSEAKLFIEQQEKKIRFQKTTSDILIEDQEQLSADKAYKLAQWYQKKQSQLKEAQTAYTEFCNIIKDKGHAGTILNITVLDSKTREKLCFLYSQFQSWLMLAAPASQKEKMVELDRYLSCIISRKTNPVLSKKEMEQVQKNMAQFTALIISNTEARSKTLTLKKFDKATQNKLRTLYDAIHNKIPNLACIAPPEHRKAFLHLEEYLFAALNNQPIDKKDRVSVEEFKILTQKSNEFLTQTLVQWKKRSYAQFDTVQNKLITTEQLTKSQVLDFYQKHRNKRNNPQEIEEAYSQFLKLLDEQDINGSLRKLEQLDDEIKNELYRLYKIFQPHFLNTIASELKNDAQMMGKYLAAVLANASTNDLINLHDSIQKTMKGYAHTWHMKYQNYHQLSEKKSKEEQNAYILKLDPDASKVRHLLGNKKYSEQIQTLRASLFELRKQFNASMNEELTPQNIGIPYPEMEKPCSQLAQSKQVRAIKELYNAFYHFEGIIKELEQLTDDNLRGSYTNAITQQYKKALKGKFVYRLLQAYDHLDEVINLVQRLSKDPHYNVIARNLTQQAQELYTALQKHTDAYQTAHETVSPIEETVQYNPLWYILNGFFIIPPHIRALKHTNPLSQNELDNLHRKAKQTTLIIEGLINNSDSYWKLLLKTPEMIKLYSALSKKLDEFTTTTHDTVFENLKETRNNVFTPMLLWADTWEQQLGLKSGTVSTPLSDIINEFYKGFLAPLHLTSKEHIDLICDENPLIQRIDATKELIVKANKKMDHIRKKYQPTADFHALLQHHKELLASYNSYIPSSNKATKKDIEESQQKIQKHYKSIIPILAKLKEKKVISVKPTNYPEDHVFDNLCNAGLKTYDRHFTEIESWVNAAYHYSLGLTATQNMTLRISEEKIVNLNRLREKEIEERAKFIDEYTHEAFKKHLKTTLARHIGLQLVNEEYTKKLNAAIEESQEDIIEQAKKAEDINQCLKNLLKKHVSRFESKHYENYSHLDSVQVALAQFSIYFERVTREISNNTAVFESDTTLGQKTALINQLKAIAVNEKIPIELRLKEIRNQVDNFLFKKAIFACRGYSSNNKIERYLDQTHDLNKDLPGSPLSDLWNYLKRCVLNLLEAVHLFTPSRKKLFNHLHDAVNNPPKIHELTRRFGLFTTSPEENPETIPAPEAEPAPGS